MPSLWMIIQGSYGCAHYKENPIFFYCFLKFQKLVENQFDQQVKIFQYEGGGEFNLNELG